MGSHISSTFSVGYRCPNRRLNMEDSHGGCPEDFSTKLVARQGVRSKLPPSVFTQKYSQILSS